MKYLVYSIYLLSLVAGMTSTYGFTGENKPDLLSCKGLVRFSKSVDDFNKHLNFFKKSHNIKDARRMVKSSYWCDIDKEPYFGYMVVRHYNTLSLKGAEYLVDTDEELTSSTIINIGMCGIPQDIAHNLLDRAYPKDFAERDLNSYLKYLRSQMKKCKIKED